MAIGMQTVCLEKALPSGHALFVHEKQASRAFWDWPKTFTSRQPYRPKKVIKAVINEVMNEAYSVGFRFIFAAAEKFWPLFPITNPLKSSANRILLPSPRISLGPLRNSG